MNIAVGFRNGYWVVEVKDSISVLDGIEDVEETVADILAMGQTRVAIRFVHTPFLSSRSISTLIRCNEKLRAAGGELAVVNGGECLAQYLNAVGLTNRFRLMDPEGEEAEVLTTIHNEISS